MQQILALAAFEKLEPNWRARSRRMTTDDGSDQLLQDYVNSWRRIRRSAYSRAASCKLLKVRVMPDDLLAHHSRLLTSIYMQAYSELIMMLGLYLRDVQVDVHQGLEHWGRRCPGDGGGGGHGKTMGDPFEVRDEL